MLYTYKNHKVKVLGKCLSGLGHQWHVEIDGHAAGTPNDKQASYASTEAAIEAGYAFAKEWIDETAGTG
ncbi:hypothetical protein [Methylobacillus glycogenes]|uniref:hypothetical protein n=1 Tax=Methylobacillus glycogenes TaxID=406 RepID=UPI000470DAE5|nr:hypothetical protein [Methylobacillus glycogenes]